ncbi:PTS transporter subunit EIIC [Breznakia pachnodae]|uniref:PTS system beta-glucosides-specific IIC component n=1 Tax=Breznakia pachnodae TaxID=265178 RepID=A0ABU0E112_9FIRM|nr:PTS transporter subunit EIIC [Breznakia pachnodae]MDQ0360469.1 PTS system beta-glucosides-specific IIC component [Breznakia pachnodae]
MANKKYEELSTQIIELIGGKGNVTYLAHCITRLRFTVKDKGKVKDKDIGNLSGVVGVNWSGDQLQIIIGQAVDDVYRLICKNYGFESAEAINENLDGKEKKKFSFNSILELISGIVAPLIPVMIAAGLIKMLVLIGDMSGILAADSPTSSVLSFAADAGFYFLPIMAGAFSAKKFGANMGLGMLMGAILLHPSFTGAVAEGAELTIFGLPIHAASYASTIIPVILIVAVMAPVERFISRYCPQVIRSMMVPLLTVLVMVPLSLVVIAPIGSYLGVYLADAFIWLYNTFGFIGIAVIACLWPLLIMTGMHQALTPYALNSFATLGYEPIIISCSIIHNFSQAGASAAVGIKSKFADTKAVALSCATSAVVGGVSEPAVYGISLKYKTPLYCAMAANFVAGAIIGINHVYAMVLGGGGIFGLPVFISPEADNLIWAVVACVIAAIIAFVATFILYKDPIQE